MPYRADKIDWNSLDLTRDAKELAAEIGCHPAQIYRARKKYGVTVPKKSGGARPGAGGGPGGFRKGSGRKKAEFPPVNVFATLDSNEVERLDAIAQRLGLTRSKVIRAAAREFIKKEEAKIWAENP